MFKITHYVFKRFVKFLFVILCVGGTVEIFLIGKIIGWSLLTAVACVIGAVINIVIAYLATVFLCGISDIAKNLCYTRGSADDIYDILCEGCGAFMTM